MTSLTTKVVRRAREKGVVVLTPRQWGGDVLLYAARKKKYPHNLAPDKPTDSVFQHITVTHDTGRTKAAFCRDMRTLERIGKERFGSGVSYNVVWDAQTGMIGIGMPLEAKGTHTVNDKGVRTPDGEYLSYNLNYVSFGITVLGMPGVKPSERAVERLILFLQAMIEVGAITDSFDYMPHSWVARKDCPTDNLRAIMPGIYRQVHTTAIAGRTEVTIAEDIKFEILKGRPNLEHAVQDLRKVRRHTKKGSPLRKQINSFLRWLRER